MIPFQQRVELTKSEASMFIFMVVLMCGLCFTTGIMVGLSLKGPQAKIAMSKKSLPLQQIKKDAESAAAR